MLFFKEHKFIAALLVISVAVIVVGCLLIASSTPPSALPATTDDENAKTVAAMSLIADLAEQQLREQQQEQDAQELQQAKALTALGDIKPQASLDRVAALNGRIPDEGSDDWCEVMMVKDAQDWTLDEQALFAKQCL